MNKSRVAVKGVYFVLFCLLAIGSLLIINVDRAYAVSENNSNVPRAILDTYNMECLDPNDGVTYGLAFSSWISDSWSASDIDIDLLGSSTSKELRWNFLPRHCNSNINSSGRIINNNWEGTRNEITGESIGIYNGSGNNVTPSGMSISGAKGKVLQVNANPTYSANPQLRYTKKWPEGDINHIKFKINGLDKLRSLPAGKYRLNVLLITRPVNDWRNGTFQCVNPPRQFAKDIFGNLAGGGKCGLGPSELSIEFEVPAIDNPTTLTINGDCSRIYGIAKDEDFNPPVLVDIRVDGIPIALGHKTNSRYEWSYDISDREDLTKHTFSVSFTNNSGDYITKSMKIGPCASVSCSLNVPGTIEVGAGMNVSATANLRNAGSRFTSISPFNFLMRIEDSDGNNVLPTVPERETFTMKGENITANWNSPYFLSGGKYFVFATINWPGAGDPDKNGQPGIQCNETGEPTKVARKPYTKLYGNDLFVGAGYDEISGTGNPGTCSTLNPDASILTYYLWRFFGKDNASASEYASYSIGPSEEFGSRSPRGNLLPLGSEEGSLGTATNDLTFGNFGQSNGDPKQLVVTSKKQPPGFYPNFTCVPDYFGAQPPATALGRVAGSLGPGIYKRKGNLTWTGGTIFGDVVLYVDGFLDITNDVTLAGFSDVNSIPSLTVIARNIRIDKSVDTVEGNFIALPSGKVGSESGGGFFTCIGFRAKSIDTECEDKLTVNGTVNARLVRLRRTGNSLIDGLISDPPGGSNKAAEEFNFLPELYFTNPLPFRDDSSFGDTYDNIVSLPPVL